MKRRAHLWYILILPVYLILFAIAEKLVVSDYWVSHLPIDDQIPFCEWFIFPYVSWYMFLVVPGLILLFKDPDGFRRYMTLIGIGFISTVAFCLLFPNGQNLRPAVMPRDNIATRLVSRIYAADTNTNVLPSVHVIGCYAVAYTAKKRLPAKKKRLFGPIAALAVLISVSTVFVKQHSVLDILAAIPWSIAAGKLSWWIQDRADSKAIAVKKQFFHDI